MPIETAAPNTFREKHISALEQFLYNSTGEKSLWSIHITFHGNSAEFIGANISQELFLLMLTPLKQGKCHVKFTAFKQSLKMP
jgi:hypothetical protein